MIVGPGSHVMIGQDFMLGRAICACGKVCLLALPAETWDGHLVDVFSENAQSAAVFGDPTWTDADYVPPPAPEEEPAEDPTWSESERAAWRAERGIPETPREEHPSRQDRSEEYAKRNRNRRLERHWWQPPDKWVECSTEGCERMAYVGGRCEEHAEEAAAAAGEVVNNIPLPTPGTACNSYTHRRDPQTRGHPGTLTT